LDKLLTSEEVVKIINHPSKIVIYNDLAKYNDIGELFGEGNCNVVVILYVNELTPQSVVGHWTVLTRPSYDDARDRREKVVEYMDSYGLLPDSALKRWYTTEHKKKTGQSVNYLTKLLYDFVNDGGKVYYNEHHLQSKDDDVATCGRHVGLRGRFYDIPLNKYIKIMNDIKNSGNLDLIITKLTDQWI